VGWQARLVHYAIKHFASLRTTAAQHSKQAPPASAENAHQGIVTLLLPDSSKPSLEDLTPLALAQHLQGGLCCSSQFLPLVLKLCMQQQERLHALPQQPLVPERLC
jgi:hypothetical protein